MKKDDSKKLSVVLAIFNEAANLSRCLDSIKDLAAEIIIVDGGSTDRSVAIAEKYGAKVFKTSNKLNFHINKQMAIDKAHHQLILQLDADEVVDRELKTFLSNLLQNQIKTPAVAWYLKRKNLFLGKWLTKGGQYPDPVIRLFIKGKAKLPQKSVHEQMIVDGPTDWADGHLLHYSSPNFASYWRKFQTYTDFTAQKLIKEGFSPTSRLAIKYLFIKPIQTSFLLAFRHKGFVDGWQGCFFALMSGFHFPVAYFKFQKKFRSKK